MYELHTMNPSFPIFFHTDELNQISHPHWHENIEILHMISGEADIVIDSRKVYWSEGDTIVVNTNSMHQFFPRSKQIEYHCLIINISFLKELGINLNDNYIKVKVRDERISELIEHINRLYTEKPDYYEPEMCSDSLRIATLLVRDYLSAEKSEYDFRLSAKLEMVKEAITYMKKNLYDPIRLDDISDYLGFTKCYFCRTFKESTGMTAIKMLNVLRCNEAKRLFLTTTRSVSEVAANCGYSNLSHFTKTYKNIIGCMPSETKRYFAITGTI